jgi:deoxyribonuclease V
MHIDESHQWDVTPSAAIGVQKALRSRLNNSVPLALESVKLVAGVDVSGSKFDPLLTAGVIVWDRLTEELVETVSAQSAITFPYIPGLLSFREIPILLQAIKKLTREPDVWMVDGQGIAHPRRLGIAAHLGLVIDRPTIGVGKSRLTGTHAELGPLAGAHVPLMDGSEQIGIVFRSKAKTNPLFISPGHLIDMESSLTVVQACLRGYRIPEPTRLAHLYVNSVRTGNGDFKTAETMQKTLI